MGAGDVGCISTSIFIGGADLRAVVGGASASDLAFLETLGSAFSILGRSTPRAGVPTLAAGTSPEISSDAMEPLRLGVACLGTRGAKGGVNICVHGQKKVGNEPPLEILRIHHWLSTHAV